MTRGLGAGGIGEGAIEGGIGEGVIEGGIGEGAAPVAIIRNGPMTEHFPCLCFELNGGARGCWSRGCRVVGGSCSTCVGRQVPRRRVGSGIVVVCAALAVE